jgi:ornithine cyclodeaminase/alanine dehydrogenase-like protein (mu-crystallin family)
MSLLLTRGDLRPLIEDLSLLDDVFRRVEDAVLQQDRGEDGTVTFLPTDLAETQKLACYLTSRPGGATVRIWPDVGSAQFPPESHLMLLLDGHDGRLLALLAGDELNLLRTSVPVGVGAKHLARPGAEVYGLFGSGEQASGHVRAVAHGVPGLKQIRVYSRTPANRERFAKEWNEKLAVEVVAVDSAEAAVREADIVSNAAIGGGSLFEPGWVRPGALITTMTGPPVQGLAFRTVVPAGRRPPPVWPRFHQAGQEAPVTRHDATLAQVMQGQAPAREREDQIVFYTVAAPWSWDEPIMRWAYTWARTYGAGTEINLSG